ncbi:head-tail adaptor [Tepidamorphus gemmatus]|uniref:Head-tail adaptor n=1 Tax=Tepidamorphus gemmatus TaxID=747076 RepID=A0A4R3MHJ1_9HYPH|nr:head-tail adaptor protein [Tepidamorphus gemmatus]TCT12668.1 head-tail adaptor [Tepidamorphus gemmatus]
MRAGKLDRLITLEHNAGAGSVDDYGVPAETWAAGATVRAQVIEAGTDEFMRGYGEATARVVVFRLRWIPVSLADRVIYEGEPFNIRSVKEIGRRRGIELRCERIGP